MFFYTQKILTILMMIVLTVAWTVFLATVAVASWFSVIALPIMAITDFSGFLAAGPFSISVFWLGTLVFGLGSVELLVRTKRAAPDMLNALADEWNARPTMRYVR